MLEPYQKPPQRSGDYIPVKSVHASSEASRYTKAVHLTSGAGMSGRCDRQDTHDNAIDGSTMWLTDAAPCEIYVQFDFGATYPLGEMWVWNYNQSHPDCPGLPGRGLRRIAIHYSLDGKGWTEHQDEGFPYELAPADGMAGLTATNLNDGKRTPIRWNNKLARYVRITADLSREGHWGGYQEGERYGGLSAVRFYAGSGLAVEPAEEWTAMFRRRSGWTGSDGIYSIPIDGNEAQGSGSGIGGKTVFVFGDTFIGEVDPATNCRLKVTMINNSLALLQGGEPHPHHIEFIWNDSDPNQPDSAIVPSTPDALEVEGSYYWLQDGTCVNGMFYCFPMIIGPYPEGKEGFQFKVHGVTVVAAPMTGEGPDLARQMQKDTPLFGYTNRSQLAYYGAAILPNTTEANVPNPDGYVYVYGLIGDDQLKRSVVARAAPGQLADLERWAFWNGHAWTEDQAEAAPISGETSSEYSVSPMVGGFLDGKYLLVYLQFTGMPAIAVHIGDTPTGPFHDGIVLYSCPEQEEGDNLILYNAKAHPHLSKPGELLISYNVNSTVMDDHVRNADIYYPRFVVLRQIE